MRSVFASGPVAWAKRRGNLQPEKTTESGGPRGYDAGKKIKGRTQHIITDTQGFLVGAVVHAADFQDRDGRPMCSPASVTASRGSAMSSPIAVVQATS